MKQFKVKTSIVYDCSLEDLNHFCQGKVLVVCDPFFIENDLIKDFKKVLKQANMIEVYGKVKPDPTLDSVIDGLIITQDFKPDIMIALGGGSAIDLAKAIMYFDKEIDNSLKYPLYVIPTTSGTGSEVTSFAVISDTKNNKKIPIVSDDLLPDIAFLDQNLVENLPNSIIAHTGMDALTHCLEAIVSTNSSIYSDALALKSLELIKENLLKSYQVGKEHRMLMHQAATMAGIAFNEASLGINHAIAHQLGAIFRIPHGKCNAILLPYVIRLNCSNEMAKQKYNKLAYDLHLSDSLSQNGYRMLINWVEKLNGVLKIEKKLSDLKIDRELYHNNLDLIASNALEDRCIETNPVQLNHDEMKVFLRRLY